MQILTLYDNLAYTFQFESAGKYYEEYLAVAQHVFDSVSINPPGSRAQMLLMILVGTGSALGLIIGFKARNRDSFTHQFLRETKRLFPSAFGVGCCVLLLPRSEDFLVYGLIALILWELRWRMFLHMQ
jgi:hypothetical protein